MRALLVKNHELSVIELPDDGRSTETIHNLIGNLFTTAFHIHPYTNRNITGFADDEGLLVDSPDWNAVMGPMLREDMQPIAGPIVIVGGTRNGESRSLTDAEVQSFRLVDDETVGLAALVVVGIVLPMLICDDPTLGDPDTSHLN